MEGGKTRAGLMKRLRRQARESEGVIDDRRTYDVTPVLSFVPGVGSHRSGAKSAHTTPTAAVKRTRGGRANSGTHPHYAPSPPLTHVAGGERCTERRLDLTFSMSYYIFLIMIAMQW